jgi:hypothetical protein
MVPRASRVLRPEWTAAVNGLRFAVLVLAGLLAGSELRRTRSCGGGVAVSPARTHPGSPSSSTRSSSPASVPNSSIA